MPNRLLFLVEGETEEEFVKELLRPHFLSNGYISAEPRLIGMQRNRSRRGGIIKWSSASQDLQRHLGQDRGLVVTTFVDYYALPDTWPGRDNASQQEKSKKATAIESAIFDAINEADGGNLHPDRFIPFVMMHEFEALLFSHCEGFANGIYRPELAPKFQAIRDDFDSPEDINDNKTTAPSKRVERIVDPYSKPFHGNLAALKIGLPAMRRECPHFDEWLRRLESIPNPA